MTDMEQRHRAFDHGLAASLGRVLMTTDPTLGEPTEEEITTAIANRISIAELRRFRAYLADELVAEFRGEMADWDAEYYLTGMPLDTDRSPDILNWRTIAIGLAALLVFAAILGAVVAIVWWLS